MGIQVRKHSRLVDPARSPWTDASFFTVSYYASHAQGLTKLLSDSAPGCVKEVKFDSYFGRKVAIDASMHIYQFMVRRLHQLTRRPQHPG
jgi:XPG N-terminal domain